MADRGRAAWDKAAGKAKEEWGDVTDDPKTEIEGKIQQGTGEVRHGAADVRDELREDEDRDPA
jgi:uncharacterized protein YjbJ (UPF0337 family)